MKLLFLGLLPVIIFWFVEEKFGTFWGLIAAIVWAVGECVYEYARNRRVDKLTLFSTGLVVILGGLGAWLDKSILFKFQPVIVELVFGGILIWGGHKGEPLLFKMAQKTKPEVFANQNPAVVEFQKNMMKKMTRNLLIVLFLHCVVLTYAAIYGTTGQWAFWKGVGFNVFLLIWAGGEFLMMRFRRKKSS
jgi:intracellular septation protein A